MIVSLIKRLPPIVRYPLAVIMTPVIFVGTLLTFLVLFPLMSLTFILTMFAVTSGHDPDDLMDWVTDWLIGPAMGFWWE